MSIFKRDSRGGFDSTAHPGAPWVPPGGAGKCCWWERELEQPVGLAAQPRVIKCKYMNDWVSLSLARYVQKALQNIEVCFPAEKASFYFLTPTALIANTFVILARCCLYCVFILKYKPKGGSWVCHKSNRLIIWFMTNPCSDETRRSRTAGSLAWVSSATAGPSFLFSSLSFDRFTSNTNNTLDEHPNQQARIRVWRWSSVLSQPNEAWRFQAKKERPWFISSTVSDQMSWELFVQIQAWNVICAAPLLSFHFPRRPGGGPTGNQRPSASTSHHRNHLWRSAFTPPPWDASIRKGSPSWQVSTGAAQLS